MTAPAPPAARRRTRLSPQVRRDQILDAAARLILDLGLSAFGMERLARDAGISKGLLYAYFPSRDALLAALLGREQAELRDRGMSTALKATTFGEVIRRTTRLYLEQMRDRGALIAPLLDDPSVAGLMEADNRAERDRTIRYFVRLTRREYGLSLPLAISAVDLLMAVTGRAGQRVAERSLGLDEAEETCARIIGGALAALAAGSAGSDVGA